MRGFDALLVTVCNQYSGRGSKHEETGKVSAQFVALHCGAKAMALRSGVDLRVGASLAALGASPVMLGASLVMVGAIRVTSGASPDM